MVLAKIEINGYNAYKGYKPELSPTIRLSNGHDIPVVGLGTFHVDDDDQVIADAIDCGYRHFDTAFFYGNEVEVGKGINAKIAEGVVKREDIFITTKLWNTFHEPEQVERAFNKSLENLNTPYIDLFLMHWPVAFKRYNKDQTISDPEDIDDVLLMPSKDAHADIDYIETWKAMENLVRSGRVRSIGVSNFNSAQIDRLLAAAEIKPVVNQVECHPNFNQRKLMQFCAVRNIALVAYSPLGRPHRSGMNLALKDPQVAELAKKYSKTSGQIVLRYTIQNGGIVIPKSVNKERIQQNIDVFDFNLSKEEMEILDDLPQKRLVAFPEGRDNKHYPFALEF